MTCVRELNLSEGSVPLRLQVAGISRRFPRVLEDLGEGRISLTVAGKLAPHLTEENVEETLEACAGMTKEEVELYLVRLAPKPLLGSSIRRRPTRRGRGPGPEPTPAPGPPPVPTPDPGSTPDAPPPAPTPDEPAPTPDAPPPVPNSEGSSAEGTGGGGPSLPQPLPEASQPTDDPDGPEEHSQEPDGPDAASPDVPAPNPLPGTWDDPQPRRGPDDPAPMTPGEALPHV